MYLSIRPLGGGLKHVFHVFATPFTAAVVACGSGWALGELLPPATTGHLLRFVIIVGVTCVIYAPLLRVLAPDTWAELRTRLGRFAKRSAGSGAVVRA